MFENYDLTHALLSVEANGLLSEGGCICMSSILTVRRIAADQGGVYRELRAASLREPFASGETPEAELRVDAAAATAIAERRAFVSELWVAHAVRHLRGGVLLVDTARNWLAERGAVEVYAWIADQNRVAIRFYEHVGFADTGERAPIARVPGALKSLFVCRRRV
ncbi:Histone acetyltransferase HPA2 and related acetyltransferases [Burkholderia singularis]|uniref:Histone acetyltransferase HPA2 and related acetyltransferases n=1 Tax=Burkholderia singularis TaxID=1503053 RepID=A0A238H3V7_9BURK|nr:Histone acetyltransferase HPA2 and related acetyltransferases [Burkholderia singularis]